MKKYIGYIILGIVLVAISIFLIYIIVSKQNINKDEFNLKRGDVLTFEKYNTEVEILNVASSLCEGEDCLSEGEVEVSVKVYYNDEESSYTLKSKSKPSERIKNSNNFIIMEYKDKEIKIDIKDKNDI